MGSIILAVKRRERLIDCLRKAAQAEQLSKRARRRILGLIEAAQLAISHIDLDVDFELSLSGPSLKGTLST